MDVFDKARYALSVDKAMLAKATTDDETPTAGYLFNDITKITFKDSQASQDLEDFLIKRLNRDSLNVKVKTLRILKHVIMHGQGDFRRNIQRRSSGIRELLQFRAPPDPIKGDAVPQEIRTLAGQIINALYEEHGPAKPAMASKGRIVGMGADGMRSVSQAPEQKRFVVAGGAVNQTSQQFDGPVNQVVPGAPPAAGQGRRMEGFGNPAFKQHVEEESVAEKLSRTVETFVDRQMAKTGDGGSSGGGYGGSGGYGGGGGGYGGSAYSYAARQQQNRPTAQPPPGTQRAISESYQQGIVAQRALPVQSASHKRGKPGGGWDQPGGVAPPPQQQAPVHQTRGGVSVQPVVHGSSAPQPKKADPGEYESRLVDDITTPGGVRTAPARDQLAKFRQKCTTLDSETVGQLLESKLEDESQPWQIRLRTLYVVDELVRHVPGYTAFFLEDPSLIQACLDSSQPAIKDRARAILRHLGVLTETSAAPSRPGGASRPAAVQPAAAAGPNLLDFDAPAADPAPPAAVAEEEEDDDAGDMFGGLTVSGSPQPTRAQAQPAQMRQAAPVAPAAAPAAAPARTRSVRMEAPASGQGPLLGDDEEEEESGLFVGPGRSLSLKRSGSRKKAMPEGATGPDATLLDFDPLESSSAPVAAMPAATTVTGVDADLNALAAQPAPAPQAPVQGGQFVQVGGVTYALQAVGGGGGMAPAGMTQATAAPPMHASPPAALAPMRMLTPQSPQPAYGSPSQGGMPGMGGMNMGMGMGGPGQMGMQPQVPVGQAASPLAYMEFNRAREQAEKKPNMNDAFSFVQGAMKGGKR